MVTPRPDVLHPSSPWSLHRLWHLDHLTSPMTLIRLYHPSHLFHLSTHHLLSTSFSSSTCPYGSFFILTPPTMQSEILRPATAPKSSLDVKNLRLNSKPESKSAFEQNQQVIPMYSTVWGVPLSESPSLPLPVRSPTMSTSRGWHLTL